MWNPWFGCRKYSEGCRFCYIHKGDAKRGLNTNNIRKSSSLNAPLLKVNDQFKWKSGSTVYLCFSSDFLIEEADLWRSEVWRIIKTRSDLNFVFLTKRIDRFNDIIPSDWGGGYDNVTVGCTVENQETADYRLSIFNELNIKHKNIICQPMIGPINLEGYLEGVELVIVGGESDYNGRPLDYQWVLDIREQCVKKNVGFQFRQCSTHFIKDGKSYTLSTKELSKQAKKAAIDYERVI